jgi:glycosyltransferase involved in cell wall biosynthesis
MTTSLSHVRTPLGHPRAWLASRSQGEMTTGSVVLHAPSSAFQAPGGGEWQLIQTGRYLEELGVAVRPFSPWTDRLAEARLLHLFGMSHEGLELARVARARGVRVVLSPICWFEPAALAALAPSVMGATARLAKLALRAVVPRLPGWRRELLGLADVILPNSRAEARQLVRLFGADARAMHVVPNGVAPEFAESSGALFRSRFGTSDFILFVGRIEPRKNVLRLVEAVHSTRLPLVVIGAPPPGQEPYARECRRAGGDGVTWLGGMDPDEPILRSAYAAARVFALPSWFETPGLAALEAALAGCAVAITPFGCTREYFGDRVEYAPPDRPSAIRRAILRAWESGPDPRLARDVATHYLWSDVAQHTAEVYDQLHA